MLLTNFNSKDVGRVAMLAGRRGHLERLGRNFNLRSAVYTRARSCELNGAIADWLQSVLEIQVEDDDFFGTSSVVSRSQGKLLVSYGWRSLPE